jgi:hypothetical protein
MPARCCLTLAQVKSGQYVADVIIEGIEMVGPENVVQVTTDSAPNCKVGGGIIMEK